MKWYHYIAAFFAGVFLCNGIPHFVNGVSGNAFPSPFANPPGRGLSPAFMNVGWGFTNLLVGYILYKVSKVSWEYKLGLAVFSIGVLIMGVVIGNYFSSKMVY
ncbi:MAG: hypothetical protein JWO03_361 [Bacteroidetes bacterium]|nr:hypothetical protein [Bacteroidota bacterium]